jgi:hypothetical protein
LQFVSPSGGKFTEFSGLAFTAKNQKNTGTHELEKVLLRVPVHFYRSDLCICIEQLE